METVAGNPYKPFYELAVREAELRQLLTDPAAAEAAAAHPSRPTLGPAASASAAQGVDATTDAALVRLLLRGPGGKAAVPQPTVLALLRAAASAAGSDEHYWAGAPQTHNGGDSGDGAAAAGDACSDPFVGALLAELSRVRAAIAAAHRGLLARVAGLGRKLPPAPASTTSSDNGAAPVTPCASVSSEDAAQQPRLPPHAAAAEAAECALLRAQADAIAADLVSIDEASRAAVAVLARLAAAHDARSSAAAAIMRSGDGNAAAGLAPPPLVAVRSHSAPGGALGRYTAGVPPDAYHQAVHCLLQGVGGKSTCTAAETEGPSAAAPSDAVLWGLSVVHARIRYREAWAARSSEGLSGGANGPWQAPDRFLRSTAKYWLRPTDALRVKAALCRHLPLLVYGASSPVHTGAVDSVEALVQGAPAARALVSSVYFDSRDLASYHERLRRDDGARATRLRWYGPRHPGDPDQAVYVERKTHREAWTGESSVKERACLRQSEVHPFLQGRLSVQQLGLSGPKAQLLTEVQQHTEALGQTPALRTEYLRSAWQAYDSAAVRVSLDEDMLMLRERGRHTAPGDWCAALEAAGPLPGGDALRFPYAVVEVKLAGGKQPPWVQELLASGLLVPATRFSKFLHGSALLFPSACLVAPPWFLPDERGQGRLTPATIEELTAQNAGRKVWVGGGGGGGGSGSGVAGEESGEQILLPPAPWLMVQGGSPKVGQPTKPPPLALLGGALRTVGAGWRRLISSGRGDHRSGGEGGGASSTASSGDDGGPPDLPTRRGSIAGSAVAAVAGAAKRNGVGTPLQQPAPVSPSAYRVSAFAGPQVASVVECTTQQQPGCVPDAQRAPRDQEQQQQGGEEEGPWVRNGADAAWGQEPQPLPQHTTLQADALLGLLEGRPGEKQKQRVGADGGRLGLLLGRRAAPVGNEKATTASEDLESGGGDQQQQHGRGRGMRLLWSMPHAASAVAQLQKLRAASVAAAARLGAAGRFAGGAGSAAAGASRTPGGAPNDHLQGFTSPPPVAPQLVRARIEPKTFFANERTFLQWIHIGVLVMMTGLGLLTGSSLSLPAGGSCWSSLTCRAARISGAIIAPTSVAVMAYALMTFKRRNARILSRETVRYDDQRGPTAITILLVTVTVIAIALAATSLKAHR